MTQLLCERLAMQLEGENRYVLGPLAYQLGLVAAQQFEIRALCRPATERLAEESSETIYLLQRSLDEARRQGWAHIRNRIPPGVTAIGKSFNASLGQVFGAVTIAGLNTRMTRQRMDLHLDRLRFAARTIEQSLAAQRWARYATRV